MGAGLIVLGNPLRADMEQIPGGLIVEMSQKHGTLIVLNGASSAGKTRVAQALLIRLGPQCAHTGLDHILEHVRPFGPEGGGLLNQLQRSMRIVWFGLTDGRLQLFKRLHREVATIASTGRPVIVETALMDRRALQDAAECFAPLGGLFVGLKPPLAVSEQWEAERGDRPRGQARKHYDLIHAHGTYDLVLDPSQMAPHECAAEILQRLKEAPPSAFRQLAHAWQTGERS
jgi:chloramphenicol 3-O phosphotransferase